MARSNALIAFLALCATVPPGVTSAETFDDAAGFSQEELDDMRAAEGLEENEEAALDKDDVLDDEILEHLSLADTDELDEAESLGLLGISEQQQQEPPPETRRRSPKRRRGPRSARRRGPRGPAPPGAAGPLVKRIVELEAGAKKMKAWAHAANAKMKQQEAIVKELKELVKGKEPQKPEPEKPEQDKPPKPEPEPEKPEKDKPEPEKPEKDKPEPEKPEQDKPPKPTGPEYDACKRKKERWSCYYKNKESVQIRGRCGKSESGELMCGMHPPQKVCKDKEALDKCSFQDVGSSATRHGWCLITRATELLCRQPSTAEKYCMGKKVDASCKIRRGTAYSEGKCQPSPLRGKLTKQLYCRYTPPSYKACEGKKAEATCSYGTRKGICQKRGRSMVCNPALNACEKKKERDACKVPGQADKPALCMKAGAGLTCRLLPASVLACKGKNGAVMCSYKSGSYEYQGRCYYNSAYKAPYCRGVKVPKPVKPVRPVAPSPGGSGKKALLSTSTSETSEASTQNDSPATRRRRRSHRS